MSDDRTRIDLDNHYPSGDLRLVERNAIRVLAHLPDARLERTRDAIQIDDGDDEKGVVILVTAETIELRLPTVEWTCGAYGPARASRLWKRVRAEALSDDGLGSMIQLAVKARRAEFKRCKYCKQLVPPEHRSGNAWHGCASRYDGVVY
jgi:hypothetical protein